MAVLISATSGNPKSLTFFCTRGSGVDGLAGMAPCNEAGSHPGGGALRIVRPLLGVAKARLRATLTSRAIPWIEDPSNQSLAFERTRWRAARGNLEALGLTSAMLAVSARRLQRARAALEAVTDTYCEEVAGVVNADRCGVLRINRQKFRGMPQEIALRLIGRCIAAAGGLGEPVPLGKLEPIVAGLWQEGPGDPTSWTLARAQISAAAEVIQIEREPGRLALPVLTVGGGDRVQWDGRFAIEIASGLGASLDLHALGEAGLAALRRLGCHVKGTSALLLAPSFWSKDGLRAVPAVDFWAEEGLEALISVDFTGLRYNSGIIGEARKDDLDRH